MREVRTSSLSKKSKDAVKKTEYLRQRVEINKISNVSWPLDFHTHVTRFTTNSRNYRVIKILWESLEMLHKKIKSISSQNVYIRYGLPFVLVFGALFIRLKLSEIVKMETPFLLFFAPIMLSSWYGGFGPGMFATTLSVFIIDLFFLAPQNSFSGFNKGNSLILFIFFIEGLLASGLSAALHRAHKRALESVQEVNKHQDILEQSEERYRLLVSDIKDYAIYMLDNEGKIVSWNEGARRILGYEEQEILGKHFSLFFIEREIKEGKPEEELRTTVIEGRIQTERLYMKKDGTTFWASVTNTAIQDETKKLRGFAKVVRDITERRIAEQEKNELLVLEQAARREAQDAVKARDEFLSIASHELKTPLTSMLLQLQSALRIVKNGSLELSSQRVVSVLKTSEEQSKRLAALINTLLDVSRITAGRLNLDVQDVNISSIVEEIAQRFHEEIKKSGSKVSLFTKPVVKGRFDKLRLEQIITNLVSNAIKYGKGRPIKISVEQQGQIGKIIIEDKGIGISTKDSERIFARFERAVEEREFKGMGVGLYIVRKIIEAHGGEITLKSKLGTGSTFTVTLPLQTTFNNKN